APVGEIPLQDADPRARVQDRARYRTEAPQDPGEIQEVVPAEPDRQVIGKDPQVRDGRPLLVQERYRQQLEGIAAGRGLELHSAATIATRNWRSVGNGETK